MLHIFHKIDMIVHFNAGANAKLAAELHKWVSRSFELLSMVVPFLYGEFCQVLLFGFMFWLSQTVMV